MNLKDVEGLKSDPTQLPIGKRFNLAAQKGERLGFRNPRGCYCLGIASKAQLLKK